MASSHRLRHPTLVVKVTRSASRMILTIALSCGPPDFSALQFDSPACQSRPRIPVPRERISMWCPREQALMGYWPRTRKKGVFEMPGMIGCGRKCAEGKPLCRGRKECLGSRMGRAAGPSKEDILLARWIVMRIASWTVMMTAS